MSLSEESLYVRVGTEGHQLHLKHIYIDETAPCVLMLHGSLENGHIFYSKSMKGLAPYLARNGFNVYVLDFRGRGKSTPAIGRGSSYGQTEAIVEDIPETLKFLRDVKGQQSIHIVAHSWGGVLMSSVLARFPEYLPMIKSFSYLAAKRVMTAQTRESFLKVKVFWNRVAFLLTSVAGYLPAKALGIAPENETRRSHAESIPWLTGKPWIDPHDNFDYGNAIKAIELPPGLYIAGEGDRDLGFPPDVQSFIEECQHQSGQLLRVGRKHGNLHDYNHVTIVAHPDAEKDHYPKIIEFMQSV